MKQSYKSKCSTCGDKIEMHVTKNGRWIARNPVTVLTKLAGSGRTHGCNPPNPKRTVRRA